MLERQIPPVMAEVRRPHLSANKKAGIETMAMAMVAMPDAINDELSSAEMPACVNRTGAYYTVSDNLQSDGHSLT